MKRLLKWIVGVLAVLLLAAFGLLCYMAGSPKDAYGMVRYALPHMHRGTLKLGSDAPDARLLALDEIVGDGDALFQRFRLRVADVFLHVGFHLPLIGGMRFAHVDGEEVRVISVIVINLDDVADLATERRSSVAAEDDHQRAAADAIVNPEFLFSAQREQRSVGRGVTGLELAAVHVRQCVADHAVGVLRAASHHGKADEGCDQEHAEDGGDPDCHSFHRVTFERVRAITFSRDILRVPNWD